MNIIIILFLFVQNFAIGNETPSKPKVGPYHILPFGLRDCENPSKPYAKDPPIALNVEFYNVSTKTFLRGNYTTFDGGLPLNGLFKVRIYRRENDSWQITHKMSSQGCRGFFVRTIAFAIGLKYDGNKCSVPVGTIYFDKIDLNKMDHKWARSREYGHFKWFFEVQFSKYTYICKEYEALVTPVKIKKGDRVSAK